MYWIRTRRGISYLAKYSAVLSPRNTTHPDTSFGRKHGSRRALLPPYNAARVPLLRSGWMGFRALFPRSLCIKKIGAPLGSRSCFSHWVQHDNGHPRRRQTENATGQTAARALRAGGPAYLVSEAQIETPSASSTAPGSLRSAADSGPLASDRELLATHSRPIRASSLAARADRSERNGASAEPVPCIHPRLGIQSATNV
eukprot:scaffold697_cov235-Pinguiococcus_pyrenoidosus.AAC.12